MSKLMRRFCRTCGWVRDHRQVMSGELLVYQCTFCHADAPTFTIPPVVIDGGDFSL